MAMDHKSLPGIALRPSIVDLTNNVLPETFVREHVVWPVSSSQEGVVMLACADVPSEQLTREIELRCGRRVLPGVALHYLLKRLIQAACDVRRECLDAVALLGDQVAADGPVADVGNRVVVVAPACSLPTYATTGSAAAASGRCAVVGKGTIFGEPFRSW